MNDKKDKAIEIIMNEKTYIDAYYAMIDKGFEEIEADYFWSKYQNICGQNA